MALYELATNSVKYCALGAVKGTVRIAWQLRSGSEGGEFQFEWRERGGPDVRPASSAGFGRKVLEQLVSLALQGSATLIFHPDGISWTLFAPAGAVLPAEAMALDRTGGRAAD
jgi:two-component system CheB/CheR fusion protein